jgi:hypothetical protein
MPRDCGPGAGDAKFINAFRCAPEDQKRPCKSTSTSSSAWHASFPASSLPPCTAAWTRTRVINYLHGRRPPTFPRCNGLPVVGESHAWVQWLARRVDGARSDE